jgi:hypothetical protein
VANLLPDPGFESGAFGTWTNVGGTLAQFRSDQAQAGTYSLLLSWFIFPPGSTTTGTIESDDITVSAGAQHEFTFWFYPLVSIVDWSIRVQHYPSGTGGALAVVQDVLVSSLNTGQWNELGPYTFTPNDTTDRIRLTNIYTGSPGGFVSGGGHWDSCVYAASAAGGAMAVKLGERSVDAVTSLLQSQLSAELGLIDTDRADGVTMAVPPTGNYYKRPRPMIIGGAAHVEVYEGVIEFENRYSDSDSQRATYTIPLTIRVTWFNRAGDSRDTMVNRGRRYSAGIYNVLTKSPNLSDSDDATIIGGATAVTPAWQTIEEPQPGTFKGSIEISAEVRCEEVQ